MQSRAFSIILSPFNTRQY